MSKWYNASNLLPPPGTLVLGAELVSDSIFPEEFLFPVVAWVENDLRWYTREAGTRGGRAINVWKWTPIPPMTGYRPPIAVGMTPVTVEQLMLMGFLEGDQDAEW